MRRLLITLNTLAILLGLFLLDAYAEDLPPIPPMPNPYSLDYEMMTDAQRVSKFKSFMDYWRTEFWGLAQQTDSRYDEVSSQIIAKAKAADWAGGGEELAQEFEALTARRTALRNSSRSFALIAENHAAEKFAGKSLKMLGIISPWYDTVAMIVYQDPTRLPSVAVDLGVTAVEAGAGLTIADSMIIFSAGSLTVGADTAAILAIMEIQEIAAETQALTDRWNTVLSTTYGHVGGGAEYETDATDLLFDIKEKKRVLVEETPKYERKGQHWKELDQVEWWLEQNPNVRGDANRDGAVDVRDFLRMSNKWGQAGAWEDGDFNMDGVVNFDDFLHLSANWTQGVAPPPPQQ